MSIGKVIENYSPVLTLIPEEKRKIISEKFNEIVSKIHFLYMKALPYLRMFFHAIITYHSAVNFPFIFAFGAFAGLYFHEITDYFSTRVWKVWASREIATVPLTLFSGLYFHVAIPVHVFVYSMTAGSMFASWGFGFVDKKVYEVKAADAV